MLTDLGWVPIYQVTPQHKVWDGVEWVAQKGALLKGYQRVISCDGVWLTPDHKVMTVSGWKTAKEICDADASVRFDRPKVRLPDSADASRVIYRSDKESAVALLMRLWQAGSARESVFANQMAATSQMLRMPSRQHHTQNVIFSAVSHMVRDEETVHSTRRQRLEELWRSGHSRVRTVGAIIRDVLEGYVQRSLAKIDAWAKGQRWGLLTTKLPVGDRQAAGEQHLQKPDYSDSSGEHDCGSSGNHIQTKVCHAARADIPVWVAGGKSPDLPIERPVYDLIDCGPRNRFVVQGETGDLLIVHNCGAVYDDTGTPQLVQAPSRLETLKEILEEADRKVIVWCPFKHVMNHVLKELNDWDKGAKYAALINGDTSAGDRAKIITAFQDDDSDLRVLIAHPATAAHGLTLTAANVCVWYGPTFSAELFEQANARVNRPGQKHKMTILRLGATPVEWAAYAVADAKVDRQKKVLDLYKNILSGSLTSPH